MTLKRCDSRDVEHDTDNMIDSIKQFIASEYMQLCNFTLNNPNQIYRALQWYQTVLDKIFLESAKLAYNFVKKIFHTNYMLW